MERSDTRTYADWLREQLAAPGVSARKVAMYAGVSNSTISAHARGVQPHAETVLKVADYFHVDPGRLLRMAGYDVDQRDYPMSRGVEQFIQRMRRLPLDEQEDAWRVANEAVDVVLRRTRGVRLDRESAQPEGPGVPA